MEQENRYSESELTPEEQRLEKLLSDAIGITPPAGLADRVAKASLASLSGANDAQIEKQLDEAYSSKYSVDLASSVYATSVSSLHSEETLDQDPVLARINSSVQWRQVALAASLTFAALISIRIGVTNSQNSNLPPMIVSNNILSFEDESLLLEDLNLSEYTYLTDTRELAFAEVAESIHSMRADIELWQYGLLTD
ncbi:MAG: hypothetical protein VX436_00790 [Planctomycetota bacterium]|nr:hypothetical protein [Planctomycetota bacterium]